MTGLAVTAVLTVALIAVVLWLTAAGFRSGDRRGDATVSAVVRDAGQADEPRPVIIARVRNPGTVPVLAGLRARPDRIPAWLRPGVAVTVHRPSARRPSARRHHPGAFAVVGVVDAGQTAGLAVPVLATARRYRLTVVVGQSQQRLRVLRLTVPASGGPPRAGRPSRRQPDRRQPGRGEPGRDWPDRGARTPRP